MSKRRIKIQSGKEEIWMEVTEEEYQRYFRPWWRQKKREQRNREAMEEKGYTEESYEAWRDAAAEDMGVADTGQPDMDELLEKEMLLGVLEEALDSLMPEERELALKVFGEQVPVSEFAKERGESRTTVSSRKVSVLGKLRAYFRGKGMDAEGVSWEEGEAGTGEGTAAPGEGEVRESRPGNGGGTA